MRTRVLVTKRSAPGSEAPSASARVKSESQCSESPTGDDPPQRPYRRACVAYTRASLMDGVVCGCLGALGHRGESTDVPKYCAYSMYVSNPGGPREKPSPSPSLVPRSGACTTELTAAHSGHPPSLDATTGTAREHRAVSTVP